uniref:Putative cucumisin isoform X2 n=1 Tax=Davidia involucrata TaxID=16924 RepID=A0A5B7BDZ7_DAVIN
MIVAALKYAEKELLGDLNYPSFSLPTPPMKPFAHTFYRIVMKVASPVSNYTANLTTYPPGAGIKIHVDPGILTFNSVGQRLYFEVTVTGMLGQIGESMIFASLLWYNNENQVRSPIVVYASS